MVTKEQILKSLKDMGAPRDKTVIVHTSLRAIGEIEGRAQTLLDALIEYFTFGGGVLCVPTHTWHNTFKEIVLDKLSPDCCIGKFSEIAVADKRGKRTSNPTHSVVLFGEPKRVQEILDNEDKVSTPTCKNGAYGRLYDGGFVLLIGGSQNKNTYLHSVEERLSVPNRLSKEPIIMNVKHEDGHVEGKPFYYIYEGDLGDVSTRFFKYEPAFRHYGGIVDGVIGNAKTQLCNAKILADVMALIRKNSGGIELLADDIPLDENWYKN